MTKTIRHLGIIMDGNGRWAKQRGMIRSNGHRHGLETAKRIVKAARSMNIPCVTLYTFSTENWRRSEEEVSVLMNLIRQGLKREYDFYRENGIRVLHSGDLKALPVDIQQDIREVEADTEIYHDMTVNLAINYGGRDEIIRSVKQAMVDGLHPDEITEDEIAQRLDQPRLGDVDLIIRTGGEQRMSNFMLWQSSYSEMYFSQTLWPDFSPEELEAILDWYQGRSRRFGGIALAAR